MHRVALYVIGGRDFVWEPATGPPPNTHTQSRSQTDGLSLRWNGSRENKLSSRRSETNNCRKKWSRRDVEHEMLPFSLSRQLRVRKKSLLEVGELWREITWRICGLHVESSAETHRWVTFTPDRTSVLDYLMYALLLLRTERKKKSLIDVPT